MFFFVKKKKMSVNYFYSLLNKQVSKKNNKLTIILDNIKHETFDENHDNISFMKNYLL